MCRQKFRSLDLAAKSRLGAQRPGGFTGTVACGDCPALLRDRSRCGTRYALRAALEQPQRARNEARCARRPCACAPRRHRDRPRRAPPAAKPGGWCSGSGAPTSLLQRRARTPGNAPLKRRAAQGMRPRAQRASLTDSPRLLERSASARSEFCGGPQDRATQGSHRAAVTAPVKRRGLGAPAFAAREASAT